MSSVLPEVNCLLCDSRTGNSIRNTISIFDNVTVSGTLSAILGRTINQSNVHSTVVCKKCYKLCNEYNSLELRLSQIKSEMQAQFNTTLPRYSTKYIKKNETVAITNSADTVGKTKKLVLPASKLKPLPPDYVILNRGNIKLGKLSALAKHNVLISPEKISFSSQNPKSIATSPISTQSLIKTDSLVFNKKKMSNSNKNSESLATPKKSSNANLPGKDKTLEDANEITQNVMNMISFDLKNPNPDKTCQSSNTTLTIDGTLLNQSSVASILNPQNSIYSQSVPVLPKNFLDSALLTKLSMIDESNKAVDNNDLLQVNDLDNVSKSNDSLNGIMSSDIDDFGNNDEQPMEIDEDCTIINEAPKTAAPDIHQILQDAEKAQDKQSEKETDTQIFEVPLIRSSDETSKNDVSSDSEDNGTEKQKYVIGKVEFVEQGEREIVEGDDEDTILMEQAEDGSIIRVVSGKKLLYENNELSLVIPQGGSDGDSIQNDDAQKYSNEGPDSNEEGSQIELQVSGDEETANAIIAAAKEKGGAFIKVESGAMYRVKTIESTVHDDLDRMDSLQAMVGRDGDQYKCMICDNTNKEDATWSASVSSVLRRDGFKGDALALSHHMKAMHSASVYICQVCGMVFRKKSSCTIHMATHGKHMQSTKPPVEKNKLHACQICKKKYSSHNLLMEHMNGHIGSRPYVCDVCSKTFASKYTFQSHLKIHLNRPRPFECNQCEKSFYTQQNLNQHEKTHLGIKEFVCKSCGKAFGTQHNLEVHGVVHSGKKPFVCGICAKAFARRSEIRDHIRTHTGERPFACDLCSATFSQRSNLRSHKRATHFDDKRHVCPHCEKRFKRRRLLDYHIKASHTGERPYKCGVCRATFVYPEHYKKHQRIHSGEKPYVCEVCGKSFTSRDNRNAHRFVHSDKKPYECCVCGAGYMRKPLLLAHMNAAGHLTETIVVNQPRVTNHIADGDLTQTVVLDPKFKETISDAFFGSTSVIEDWQVAGDEDALNPLKEDQKLMLDDDRRAVRGDEQVYTVNIFSENDGEERRITFTTESGDGKAALNIIPDATDPSLLTLADNIVSTNSKAEVTILPDQLEAGDADKELHVITDQEGQLITTEDGTMIRLVQIQLSDGNNGWAMINAD